MPKSIPGVMSEFKSGQLHSGSKSGPVVTKRKQAVAIALHEQQGKSSGMFGSRRPEMPDLGTQGALTVRNQLRGQRGRAR